MDKHFIHGHRGARGMYPENTLRSFRQLFDASIRAIEIDIVISKDRKVVISHEPWMNHLFCLQPNGTPITQKNEKEFNLFEMEYSEIAKFDCGSKTNINYPDQKAFKAIKPLLTDLDTIFTPNEGKSIFWNIEIKSEEHLYNTYQPEALEFTELVLNEIKSIECISSFMIQSFDINIVNTLHQLNNKLSISYLIENKNTFENNLSKLDFTPSYYNPDYTLVTKELISKVLDKGMKIIPWTVNDRENALQLISQGVDGIITDYPTTLLPL